jgi:5'-deoxynucleotidase YfbR-like HD superfamily hydrolase
MKKLRAAGGVKRYHTVPIIGQQTVAEHSFQVCLILTQVFGDKVTKNLLKAALFHDLAEIETGDIPAPAKRRYSLLHSGVLEAEVTFEMEHKIDVGLTKEEHKMLKFADYYELVLFCFDQLELGNRNVLEALGNGLAYLREMDSVGLTAEFLIETAEKRYHKHAKC